MIVAQSNKALIYRDRFVFAYTGLAEFPIRTSGGIRQQSTIEWAGYRLSEEKNLMDGIEHLKNQLTHQMNTNQVRRISPERRRVAFVGAGFEDVEEAGQVVRKPRRIVISNFLENDGTMQRYPRDRFTIDSSMPADDSYVSLYVTGQQLSEQRRKEFTKILKVCVQHTGLETVGSLLSSEVKMVARSGNRFVGEGATCTFVPRAFVDTNESSIRVHVGTLPFHPLTANSQP